MNQTEFLKDYIDRGIWLNDNHNNYVFLEFWDKFYPNKKFEHVKRNFHYHMSKLVNKGLVKKSFVYLNTRDISNFGRHTIINYQPIKL